MRSFEGKGKSYLITAVVLLSTMAILITMTFIRNAHAIAFNEFGELLGSISFPSQKTIIELEGRVGAQSFTDINTRLVTDSHEQLIKRAVAAISNQPNSGLAYEVLGTALFNAGRLDEAQKAFEKAVSMNLIKPALGPNSVSLRWNQVN